MNFQFVATDKSQHNQIRWAKEEQVGKERKILVPGVRTEQIDNAN